MAFTYVPGQNVYNTSSGSTSTTGSTGTTGSVSINPNQMGPAGPGIETYVNQNPNVVTYQSPNVQLESFIQNNQDDKNQPSTVESVLQDIPKKRKEFILRNTKNGKMNQAALSMFNFYNDGRNEYQRKLNRLINSSPEMMQAYAKKFPLTSFAMNAPANFIKNTLGGKIVSSIGGTLKDKLSIGVGTLKDKIANVINPKFVDPYPNASSSYDYDSLNIEGYPDEIQRRLQVGPISEDDTSETNIEAIKDEKTSYKNTKIQNAQDTFTFYNTLNNPSNVLPPNFASTFEKLKDTNQLTSGDFLKANQLLRDIVPTQEVFPPMINAQNTGINQVLPKEIETANLFGNFQPNFQPIVDQVTPIVDQVNEYREILNDGKGLDLDLQNQGVSYTTPLFGGTLTGGVSDVGGDNPTAGLFFNKLI